MNTFAQFMNFSDVLSISTEHHHLVISLRILFSLEKPSYVFHFESDQCLPNVYKDSSDMFVDPLKNARRLYFLSAAICTMITGQYSCAVPLPVEAILESLNHFMIISNGNIKDSHSVDVFAVGHVLPMLYENIFNVLTALLTRFDLEFADSIIDTKHFNTIHAVASAI